ncbi:PLAT domain-containing protein 2-like [Ananas comosus]|uniref:PLAT domain-containing protein 2-like n=1 Tax=Ananas comosus TaxID=4615 RepID=A0A6P5F390_ANACO|nr:PLAT domain-containing protein 2-like [Ananas comosus]
MAATIAWKPLYFLLPFLLPFLAYSTGRPIIEGAGLEQGCGVGSGGSNHCLYTLRVQTGNRVNAGTDSKISVTLAGPDHVRYHVPNLESWGGLMWDGYNYFERGYADAFAGCGTCITWPPCWIRLTSDGSGSHPGWFVDFVELWAAGPDSQCTKHRFDFHVWLAAGGGHHLTAVRDNCRPHTGNNGDGDGDGNGNGNGVDGDEEK